MTTPRQWWLIKASNLSPRQLSEIEFPGIIKLIVVIIFATENVHTIAIDFIQLDNC